MDAVTGLHRKFLIRLINGDLLRTPRRRERGTIYDPEVDDAVRVIARSLVEKLAHSSRGNFEMQSGFCWDWRDQTGNRGDQGWVKSNRPKMGRKDWD
jgi:hypothetical protein